MRRLFLLSLITLGTLLFPISVSASYAPADRETFSCVTDKSCPGPTFVTFNSFVDAPSPDAPAGGDERAFFEVKDASSSSINDGFSDNLAVHDGQRIMMRVFIHNNANPSLMGIENAKAKNASVMVQLPSNMDTSNTPVAYITADNATPRQISDTATITGAGTFNLTFDQSSINITDRSNEGNGDFVTHQANSVSFKDASNMRVELGDWPGGFKRHGSLTFTAVVHSNNTTSTTAQTCSALDVNGIDRSRATFTAHSATGVTATSYSFTVKDPNGITVDNSTVNTNATTANYNFNQSNPGTYTISAVTNTAGTTNNTPCVRQITVQAAPVTLAASTSTTAPPATTTLPNTGVGNVAGVFAGISALAGSGHYIYRRRQN